MLALKIIATVLLGIMALLKLCASRDEEVLIALLLAIPDVFAIVVIWVI